MSNEIPDETNSEQRAREARTGEDSGTEAVSTGVGAVGGGLAGAAIGTAVAGPIGTAVGAVIGAVAGGVGGYAVGSAIDSEAEDRYWREHHAGQPFARTNRKYEDYQPAYRTGFEAHDRYADRGSTFEEVEPDLRTDYEAANPNVPWDEARDATRAAWTRVHEGQAVRIPVSEEQVRVGKREVGAGEATIRKEVRTETVNTPVELRREELVVERTGPEGVTTTPEDAFREGEVRIPLTREEPVVEKESHVVGEVKVSKRAESETRNISETVRKEDVRVEGDETTDERRER